MCFRQWPAVQWAFVVRDGGCTGLVRVVGGRSVRLMLGGRAYFWVIVGVAMAIVGTDCRQATANTLEWALMQAYQNNPSLNAQRAALRAAGENVPQALSGYRPKLSITASGGYSYEKSVAEFPRAGVAVVPFAQTFYPGNWLSLPEKLRRFNDITFLSKRLVIRIVTRSTHHLAGLLALEP